MTRIEWLKTYYRKNPLEYMWLQEWEKQALKNESKEFLRSEFQNEYILKLFRKDLEQARSNNEK